MNVNILVISDIHWGAINPNEQWTSMEFIFEFIKDFTENHQTIDMIVLLGDYFDSKLPLNSDEARLSIKWFHRMYDLCCEKEIILRLVQGTLDHDNDQLDTFEPLLGKEFTYHDIKTPIFRIIKKTTLEEPILGFKCVYCPDENLQTDEYEETYINEILSMKDIGFFHGSFDVVFGDLLKAKPELYKKNNVIFRYGLWDNTVKGPMIAGHWHDGKRYMDLFYTGSPCRWKFDEDEPKGFLFIQYNTENNTYKIQKILNPLCPKYLTFEVFSNLYHSQEDYGEIVLAVRNGIKEIENEGLKGKLRVVFYVVDEKPENDVFVSAIKEELIDHKNCKIVVKNKLRDKKKKQKEKKEKEEKKKFNFISEERNNPEVVIQKFIQKTIENPNDAPPIEFIKEKMKNYI